MFAPNYTITNNMLNTIAEIEAIRVKVSDARILPERFVELRYRATVEQTHSSTSIEGNPLTLAQVDFVLQDKGLTRHVYAEIEVRNYKAALEFIDKRKAMGKSLEYEDLLKLHELAMKGLLPEKKTGVLRKGTVYIVDHENKIKYIAPDARSVRRKLEFLLAWLNTTKGIVHPCIAAALLHYQFASIHPFADGNGRTARLATMLYLGICDYDWGGAIVLDTYYAQARGDYYAALNKCQGEKYKEGQDLTSWIVYFTEGVLSSSKVLLAEITILATFAATEPAIKKRTSQDSIYLMSYARQFGSVSISEAEEILPDLSRRTLQRKLKALADSGYLRQENAARNTLYHWVD